MGYAHNQPEYHVSELAACIKQVVEERFGHVRVRGEISKCQVNGGSGHAYITLKDDKAVLEAVCWRGVMEKLTHKPEAGMEVIATGRLTTYGQRSQYQLVIEAIEPAGIGALMAMLEARKKQLAAEGLFDAGLKKPIPFLPQTIGVITSPTGAVIRDILHRIADRFPSAVTLWPVLVQGEGAAEQVVRAIEGFHQFAADAKGAMRRPDVLIIARGGGSIEDLWAFNEEIVARAVAKADIPIISAIGHETDTTLIDYVADWRAPTPTAAAEKAVPVRRDLLFTVQEYGLALPRALSRRLEHAQEKLGYAEHMLQRFPRQLQEKHQWLDGLSERLAQAPMRGLQAKHARLVEAAGHLRPRNFLHMLEAKQGQVQQWQQRLQSALQAQLTKAEHRVQLGVSKLALLDVQNVLKRGFALVKTADGLLVSSAEQARAQAPLTVQLADGAVPVFTHAQAMPAVPVNAKKKAPTRKKSAPAQTLQESLF